MLILPKEAGLALTGRRNDALGKMLTKSQMLQSPGPNDRNKVSNYLMHHLNKAATALFFLLVNPSSNLKKSKCMNNNKKLPAFASHL